MISCFSSGFDAAKILLKVDGELLPLVQFLILGDLSKEVAGLGLLHVR